MWRFVGTSPEARESVPLRRNDQPLTITVAARKFRIRW